MAQELERRQLLLVGCGSPSAKRTCGRSSALPFGSASTSATSSARRGDIYGDGVNIAVRLEALAEPQGICLSGDAYRQVRKLALDFEDMREREVKNIAEPIRVFRVGSARITEALQPPTPPRCGLALPSRCCRSST
jgi:class 3 adenylate cyclase